MSDQNEQAIEREVTRRVASATQKFHDEIEQRDQAIEGLTNDLMSLSEAVQRLERDPYYFGSIIMVENTPEPERFQNGDIVTIVDKESFYGFAGEIVSQEPVVSDDGMIDVKLSNNTVHKFQIGTHGPAQVRLAEKSDGTSAIVSVDGHPWEVCGAPDLDLKPGDPVKIHPESKQIFAKADHDIFNGNIAIVEEIGDPYVEVTDKGEKKVVLNPRGIDIQEGDRVVLDPGNFVIYRKIAGGGIGNRYRVSEDLNATWDDLGGLKDIKDLLRSKLEFPYKHPELYKHYNSKPPAGMLLYGPPGNGKTLVARIVASELSRIYQDDPNALIDPDSYLYVKGPEILDRYVGNTEAEIRSIFAFLRNYKRKSGHKGFLVIDEVDAIAPSRGSRISSDISDTIVPMLLGEMDGIDPKQKEENPIVFLLTNRQDKLDNALTRPGRISIPVKIPRPTKQTAHEIFAIHSRNLPFDEKQEAIIALTIRELFSEKRVMYHVNNINFTFGDCVSGAMIEEICSQATQNAIMRDINAGGKATGLVLDDFKKAVEALYEGQKGLNHDLDFIDFAERHGFQPTKLKIKRVFGNS